MSILGLLGIGGGSSGGGYGAGGATAFNQAGAGTVTINTGIGGANGLQNVGSILAILNQGASQNGAVNYESGALFQSLNPTSSENPYEPATLVGPNPLSSGPSSSAILLVVLGLAVVAFFVFRKDL